MQSNVGGAAQQAAAAAPLPSSHCQQGVVARGRLGPPDGPAQAARWPCCGRTAQRGRRPPPQPNVPPPLAPLDPNLHGMTSTLLRCTLASLRVQGRAGLRRAAQQWRGGPAARPLTSGRAAGSAAAAAAVEVQQAGAAAPASAQQQAQPPAAAPEAPAYRAYIDFKFVRDNVEAVAANCRARLSSADPHLVAQLYEQYVAAQQETDKLRAARNENSSAMKVPPPPPAAAAACSPSPGRMAARYCPPLCCLRPYHGDCACRGAGSAAQPSNPGPSPPCECRASWSRTPGQR